MMDSDTSALPSHLGENPLIQLVLSPDYIKQVSSARSKKESVAAFKDRAQLEYLKSALK